jgi:hypothetical protein
MRQETRKAQRSCLCKNLRDDHLLSTCHDLGGASHNSRFESWRRCDLKQCCFQTFRRDNGSESGPEVRVVGLKSACRSNSDRIGFLVIVALPSYDDTPDLGDIGRCVLKLPCLLCQSKQDRDVARVAASRATASIALPLRPGTLMKISASPSLLTLVLID